MAEVKAHLAAPASAPVRSPSPSGLSGLHRLKRADRVAALTPALGISALDLTQVAVDNPVDISLLESFVENVIGRFSLPLAVATNFRIDGEDFALPMVVEESSVVAAASAAAKTVRENGGFSTQAVGSSMIGQVEIKGISRSTAATAATRVQAGATDLAELTRALHPRLEARGGGFRGVECRFIDRGERVDLVAHLLIDCGEAMGANITNTVCEAAAPLLRAWIGEGRIGLRILSNYNDRRRFIARCEIAVDGLAYHGAEAPLSGAEVAARIEEATAFADADPFRAATHNKGIMNGVDPVAIATGNDWRAIEAGAHAHACRDGRYRSLSSWRVEGATLVGTLDLPLQMGVVGGVTRLHPTAQAALAILRHPSAARLSALATCAGLASNFSALRALCTSGIQKGHMRLHEKNLKLLRAFPTP